MRLTGQRQPREKVPERRDVLPSALAVCPSPDAGAAPYATREEVSFPLSSKHSEHSGSLLHAEQPQGGARRVREDHGQRQAQPCLRHLQNTLPSAGTAAPGAQMGPSGQQAAGTVEPKPVWAPGRRGEVQEDVVGTAAAVGAQGSDDGALSGQKEHQDRQPKEDKA